METIAKLPDKKYFIGAKEIIKNIAGGKIKEVVIARNCPDFLREKIPKDVAIKAFDGDQKDLGTKLGKSFAVAMIGYE